MKHWWLVAQLIRRNFSWFCEVLFSRHLDVTLFLVQARKSYSNTSSRIIRNVYTHSGRDEYLTPSASGSRSPEIEFDQV